MSTREQAVPAPGKLEIGRAFAQAAAARNVAAIVEPLLRPKSDPPPDAAAVPSAAVSGAQGDGVEAARAAPTDPPADGSWRRALRSVAAVAASRLDVPLDPGVIDGVLDAFEAARSGQSKEPKESGRLREPDASTGRASFPWPPDFSPPGADVDLEEPPPELERSPRPSPVTAAWRRASDSDAAARKAQSRAVAAVARITDIAAGRPPSAELEAAQTAAETCAREAQRLAAAAAARAQRALDALDLPTASSCADEAHVAEAEAAKAARAAEAWADYAQNTVHRSIADERRDDVRNHLVSAKTRLEKLALPEPVTPEDRRNVISRKIEILVLGAVVDAIPTEPSAAGDQDPAPSVATASAAPVNAALPPTPAPTADLALAPLAGANPVPEALTDEEWRFVTLQPRLAYSVACFLVRWRGMQFDVPPVRFLFDTALTSDLQSRFIPSDPELTTAADTAGFGRLKKRAADVVEAIDAADKKMRAEQSTAEEPKNA
ncbi:hypothetical protein G5T42_02255 [Microbacterium sp. 4R-513]|uniref:hypothetical protein n=1 Tax=Microbacterium sp. 4R-513 TaxID=2567934 RepID=UPI0013E19445|nr:hypothetical protein [Microbacterium sp. 4R-513]QIG38445.1 hypothetical protein G5T42_02255 [Microbacterium sp. 4R-513]